MVASTAAPTMIRKTRRRRLVEESLSIVSAIGYPQKLTLYYLRLEIVEHWNDGTLCYWNTGIAEYWNVEILGRTHHSSFPPFHYSDISFPSFVLYCRCPTELWQRRQASCPALDVGCVASIASTISRGSYGRLARLSLSCAA